MTDCTQYDEQLKVIRGWMCGKFMSDDKIKVNEPGHIYFYTNDNEYSITFNKDYLGCIVSDRKPLPGENWTRSSDLCDGPFSHDTWLGIMNDILSVELVDIS